MAKAKKNSKPTGGLNDRAYRTLQAIDALLKKNSGTSPTYDEIAECLGITVGAAYVRVMKLVEMGWLTRTLGRSRSVQLAVPVPVRRSA